MTARALLTTLYILLAGTLQTQAQSTPDITARQRLLGIRDGLPSNGIAGMDQDSHGLMWIATWNGLCCFDGNRFTTFPGNAWGNDDALSSNRIAMVHIDTRDNVWLRTYDGGLYLYDTRQCRYVNIKKAVEEKYQGVMKPRNIYCLPNGHTWVTDETGAMTLRIDDQHPTDVNRIELFSQRECGAAIGTKGYKLPDKMIRKVECDQNGNEWISTDQRTLRHLGRGKFKVMSPKNMKPWKSSVGDTALAWRLKACGMTNDDIEKHYIDRQGNLWFSSTRGLTLVNFRQQRMRKIPVAEGQQVRAVLCRHNGTVWAGTQDGYIRVIDCNATLSKRECEKWLAPDGHASTAKVRFADRIYALFEDSHHRVWIGTKGQGLFIVEDGKPVNHCTHDDSRPYSVSSNNIYDFDEDAQGNIWIATYDGGVNVWVPTGGDGRFLHSGNELRGYPIREHGRVRRITHNKEGVMLIATTNGLLTTAPLKECGMRNEATFHITRHELQDTTSLLTSDVMQVLVTKNGIYVSTQGGGIQKVVDGNLLADGLKLRKEEIMSRSVGNVLSMTEDAQGGIWIVREMGIERYDANTGQMQQYGPNSMGEDSRLTEAKPALAGDGHLWLGAMDGVLTFNTSHMQKSDFTPHIVFTNVQYQGEQTAEPLLYRQTLTVTPDRRNLTISFAALDFEDNYLMQYAYRMAGDDQWNYIRTPHVAFNELQPGIHQLEVKSTNSDGVWTDNTATLTLDVRPVWWERTGVQLLLLLTVIALSTRAVMAWLRHRQHNREREQRLDTILHQYRELQEQLNSQQEVVQESTNRKYTLTEPEIENPDEKMMDKLMKFIEERVSDDTLKIEDMAEAVNMGRTVFYEKIRQLVGVSPIDFLKQVRMERAMQLVAKSRMPFSQIAYSIGFTDPKYFTKCFKKYTGMTPSDYRTSHETDLPDNNLSAINDIES